VRTQVYQGLLWQQVIDEKKLKPGARLPPLLLLVLYNGAPRWGAATDIRELIALSPDSALWPWQPQVRYYLLEMGAFSERTLARRRTLVALLFRLEQRRSPDEINDLLGEVMSWFRRHQGYERLRGLFAELVREALTAHGAEVPRDILELTTVKSNLSKNIEAWKHQLLAEGLTKGKADALLCLLAVRFGSVTPSLHKRIHRAELPTLERWFKRAVVAPDLRSVFAPPR